MALTISAALHASAQELTDLAVVADRLVGAGVAEVERWQALDRLSQHLSGLAVFLAGVATATPGLRQDVTAALNPLTNLSLVSRLLSLQQTDAEAGALELFQP